MDFAFSKILLVGIVALIVVGPKRLPSLARKAGMAVGRILAIRDQWLREMRAAADPWTSAGEGAAKSLTDLRSSLEAQFGAPSHGPLGSADPWAGLARSSPSRQGAMRLSSKARRAKSMKAQWELRLRGRKAYVAPRVRPARK